MRPALALAAAIGSTTSTSFRYQADLVQRTSPDDPRLEKAHCTGVIDLATQSGYSKYGLTEHWVVDGVRYLKEGNHRYVIGKGDTPALHRDVTMRLSDYGVRVSRTAPW